MLFVVGKLNTTECTEGAPRPTARLPDELEVMKVTEQLLGIYEPTTFFVLEMNPYSMEEEEDELENRIREQLLISVGNLRWELCSIRS